MIPFNKPKLIFISIAFFFLGSAISLFFFIKQSENFRSDYLRVSYEQECIGIIMATLPYQSVSYIETTANEKIMLGYAMNKMYAQPYLMNFLKVGDSIAKPMYSDTLYVFRDSSMFYFILDNEIP